MVPAGLTLSCDLSSPGDFHLQFCSLPVSSEHPRSRILRAHREKRKDSRLPISLAGGRIMHYSKFFICLSTYFLIVSNSPGFVAPCLRDFGGAESKAA